MQNYKSKFKILFLAIIFFCLFGLAQNSEAKVINVVNTSGQPSCEQVDVQRVINDTGTADGDTVFVPEGSCTWTTTIQSKPSVLLDKGVKLQGAGIDKTIITDGTDLDGGEIPLNIKGSGSKMIRVTGFTFITNTYDAGAPEIIIVNGPIDSFWKYFRIDHSKFIITVKAQDVISVHNGAYGLIDHNTFLATNKSGQSYAGIEIESIGHPNSRHSLSFKQPNPAGTENAVYIEDNVFECPNTNSVSGSLDGKEGGQFVARYNTFHHCGIQTHDTAYTGTRGIRHYEFYNNVFDNVNGTTISKAIALRGGTGVLWDNVFSGEFSSCILLMNYRTGEVHGGIWNNWDYCESHNPCDGNSNDYGYPCMDQIGRITDIGPGSADSCRARESRYHNGTDNSMFLFDDKASFVINKYIGYRLSNLKDNSSCIITANDKKNATCTLSGGAENDWDIGEPYRIYNASAIGPIQPLDPLYAWSNKCKSDSYNAALRVSNACAHRCSVTTQRLCKDDVDCAEDETCNTAGESFCGGDVIKPGRDFYDETQKPGYTPYTYPHPLTFGDDHTSPSAPTGVVVE